MAWHRVKADVSCQLILGQDVIADVDKLFTTTAQMVLTPPPDDCLELRNLQHNARFLDKRCQKRRQRVPKTAPLALRRPRDREPLFLACTVKCNEICHFCRSKLWQGRIPSISQKWLDWVKQSIIISQAQNGFPRPMRPVFRRRLLVQHNYCMDCLC